MKVRLAIHALVLLSSSIPAIAFASEDERQKTETDGLALSAGIGSQYPLVGVQAAYYLQLPRSLLRVVGYASLGGGICVGAYTGCDAGAAFGVMGSWGHKHRIVADLFYGTVGAIAIELHGQSVDSHPVWGIGLALGYEYMAFGGFFFRTEAGLVYAFSNRLVPAQLGDAATLAGFGYKFW